MMVWVGFDDMVVALDRGVRGLRFGGAACRSQAAAFEVWTFLTVTPAITSVRLDAPAWNTSAIGTWVLSLKRLAASARRGLGPEVRRSG